jgi:hypothetical protein
VHLNENLVARRKRKEKDKGAVVINQVEGKN